VPIPLHKAHQAYLDYIKKKDYPAEIINEMGKSRNERIAPDPKVGAKRLLHKVAREFPDQYMEVGQEKGLNLGIIDAVSLAAWQEDTGIKDWQMVRSLKHLRHNLKGKVSVPFIHTKKFSEGYVKPKVKKFEHQYEKSGEIVSIECWYQDVDKMSALLIGEKLTELQLKPNDVKSIDFILGGDHGKDAFRLCFRVVIALEDDKMHYIDYGGAGTVFGKDTCEVLEKSIMPWLTEDLKRIHQCQLVIEEPDEDGKIVCAFLETTDDETGNGNASRKVIEHVEIYNTGDLKWMAMLLGMSDMSNEWCIFCMMRKMQWNLRGHDKGDLRTIEKIIELANDSTKKNVERLGVKTKPYWDFIPVENYTIPLLHILIGVFNDVDDFFMDLVDGHIIPLCDKEKKLREDMKTIDSKINPLMKAVTTWKSTQDRKDRSRLLTKKNKMNDLISRGEPAGPFWMSVDEVSRYQDLEKEFNRLCNVRDSMKKEKKKKKEKLEAYRRERKIDPKSVHNDIERLATENGLDRGAAFGGKYNGKVARKVMEDPSPIYLGVRDILKERKAPHITDQYIDDLCTKMVDVMSSWNEFFSILQKETPTEEDRSKVDAVAKKAVDKHIALVGNITPKVHIAEDHAVDQYLRVRPGLVRLLIEHWVERNHQDGHRIEQQFKNERNIGRKAEFVAGKMHKKSNPEIRQKITEVHKSKRICDVPGKYSKRKRGDAITPSPSRRTITRNLSPTTILRNLRPTQDLEMCLPCTGLI